MKYLKVLKVISLILVFTNFSACAPSLEEGILRVSPLRLTKKEVTKGRTFPVLVHEFRDSRTNEKVGEIEGRDLKLDSRSLGVVRYSLEQELRKRGARFTPVGSNSIYGEVLDWYIKIVPGFPFTRTYARAKVRTSVVSDMGAVLFEGQYEGTAKQRDMFPSADKIEDVLGKAMAYAVESMLEDSAFLETIKERATLKKNNEVQW